MSDAGEAEQENIVDDSVKQQWSQVVHEVEDILKQNENSTCHYHRQHRSGTIYYGPMSK